MINSDKPNRWNHDISTSIKMYNNWFINFAPKAFQSNRDKSRKEVEQAFTVTNNLVKITADVLRDNPQILPVLRMTTCPPLASDRLKGLSEVSTTLIKRMEKNRQIPPKMPHTEIDLQIHRMCQVLITMRDRSLFPWLDRGYEPTIDEITTTSNIVADRLCTSLTDPIIRNAQETRQLEAIERWLHLRGYGKFTGNRQHFLKAMPAGTYCFHVNVLVSKNQAKTKLPVDIAVKPLQAQLSDIPILFEAKSAGDFINPNKRRKEEATKIHQLQKTYSESVQYLLVLCGYFDMGYLSYEADSGIDWIWEHRLEDLTLLGI